MNTTQFETSSKLAAKTPPKYDTQKTNRLRVSLVYFCDLLDVHIYGIVQCLY